VIPEWVWWLWLVAWALIVRVTMPFLKSHFQVWRTLHMEGYKPLKVPNDWYVKAGQEEVIAYFEQHGQREVGFYEKQFAAEERCRNVPTEQEKREAEEQQQWERYRQEAQARLDKEFNA
jgi:hypothetical protein